MGVRLALLLAAPLVLAGAGWSSTASPLHPSHGRARNGELVLALETGADDPSGRSILDGPLDVIPATGGPARRLITGLDSYPAWSPDGNRLAYDGVDGLTVARADGSGRRLIARDNDSAPSWSRSGRRIVAVDTSRNVNDELINIASDGSDPRWIRAHGLLFLYVDPVWSPDGRWIAFAGSDDRLHLMHPDGTGLRVLAHTHHDVFTDLTWSPDGHELIFTADDGLDERHTLAVVDVTDGAVHTSADPRPFSGRTSNIVWSPDGQQLVWAAGTVLDFLSLSTHRIRHVSTGLTDKVDIQWLDWQPVHPVR